ncbi:acireductone synthase [Streptomyces acidiscabies]|uniref:acireductone synthase n=1 Tax=Streptomyces acidiscabies TaxID=42234 RepID=UPI0009514675|nr:acireductone synthase [Streptomyces acidiscabies]
MTGAVVLDIEGTTSSTSQVHDVLFPYARRRMAGWVAAHRNTPEVRQILSDVARAPGITVYDDGAAVQVLERWSDDDRKAGPLKQLQGLIWAEGYARGELTGHVYPDTIEALDLWEERGVRVHIYSSGSVLAQRLWFKHTRYGDLCGRLTHYFDTVSAGSKTEADSYRNIASFLRLPPDSILFASDTVAELDAARLAGWCTALVRRSQEPSGPVAAQGDGRRHPVHPDLVSIAQGREQ